MARTLTSELYLTVHGSAKSVEQLADEIGISPSYLYRMVTEGESGAPFKLELLIPLMQATGDYRVLEHLNARCERMTLSIPRCGKFLKNDPQAWNDLQAHFAALVTMAMEFFKAPSIGQIPEILGAIQKHLCEIAAMRRAVQHFSQRELELTHESSIR